MQSTSGRTNLNTRVVSSVDLKELSRPQKQTLTWVSYFEYIFANIEILNKEPMATIHTAHLEFLEDLYCRALIPSRGTASLCRVTKILDEEAAGRVMLYEPTSL